MVFENKNPYKLSIDSLLFKVKLNDTLIANESVHVGIKLAGFDMDTASLPLHLHIKKIRGLIAHVQGQDSTTAGISGTVIYKTVFGRTSLNFNKTSNIVVPVPPKFKVLKVERKGFDVKNRILHANAVIKIINDGKNLDLKLADVSYTLVVKNTLRAEGVIKKSIIILPQSSTVLNLPIQIKVFHPLKTLLQINRNEDQLPYTLHLKGNVTEHLSDKAFTAPAEIEASGTLELVK